MNPQNIYQEQERITRYLQGEMNEVEKLEFEKQMVDDSFLREAVEGFQLSGALPQDLEIIDNPAQKKRNKTLWSITIMLAAAAACFALFIWFPYSAQISPNTTHTLSQLAFRSYGYHRIIAPQHNDTLAVAETETLFITETRNMPEPKFFSEQLPPLYVAKSLTIENHDDNSNNGMFYRFRSNHPYTYLQGFKVVDYRFAKRNNQKIAVIPTNRKPDVDENKQAIDINDSRVAYVNFLEQALVFLKNKNYNDAVESFDIILEQYPGDLNALFYTALCYYENGDNNKARSYFSKSGSAYINTFREESQWYGSLILKEERQYAAAEKALNEIINENGYYGAQAKRELDKLYEVFLHNE